MADVTSCQNDLFDFYLFIYSGFKKATGKDKLTRLYGWDC